MLTKLKALRLREGVGQASFAARIGVSVNTYGPIETGRTKPTERVALKMEAAFGRPVSELIAEVA